MSNQSILIDLQDNIYNKFKHRAEQMQRSVEAEILESITKAVPTNDDELSAELQELVIQLGFLDDKALGRIASSRQSKKEVVKIETLHLKRQSEGLDAAESKELIELMRKFDRWFVLRNEAISLLLERGRHVSEYARGK